MVCWVPSEGAGAEPLCHCCSAVAERQFCFQPVPVQQWASLHVGVQVLLLLRLTVALLESVSVQRCSTDHMISESFFWDLFCMAQDSVAIFF